MEMRVGSVMNMLEMFSQALFEGVQPMMVKREYLVRHPDRCTHNAVCIPVCPTGAWLSTPPFKFDAPDRKSTRLNSSHDQISYAVFCLKKKKRHRVYYHLQTQVRTRQRLLRS